MATRAKKATPAREKVIGVTIHVLSSEGHCKTITIDPELSDAIFWTDRAVNEILAPFYEKNEKFTTQEELITRFGPQMKATFKQLGIQTAEVRITPELVKAMWQMSHDNGDQFSYILKTRKCIPRPCK
ncbi:MAG: hypothetical protein ACKO22_05680 [Cyanobium sp.]